LRLDWSTKQDPESKNLERQEREREKERQTDRGGKDWEREREMRNYQPSFIFIHVKVQTWFTAHMPLTTYVEDHGGSRKQPVEIYLTHPGSFQ
jgi:hypothetical protein